MTKPLLQAKNIHKTFTFPSCLSILADVNLSVFPESSTAIMGRSGAGKTTLLHILGTLEGYDKGFLEIAGSEVTALNAASIRGELLGFVFQSYQLLEDFTLLENVLIPARILRKNVSKNSPVYERGLKLLSQVGLQDRAHFPAKLLSGGEKQRASIARALCNDPPLILADEPSGNLDEETAKKLYQLLLDLVRIEGKTLIVVTHDEMLAKLCDQIYTLSSGKLFS